MAERELLIKYRIDTSQADQDADAFWRREAQRQQGAAQQAAQAAQQGAQQARAAWAGAGGGAGGAGGGGFAAAGGGGALPGNIPGPVAFGGAALPAPGGVMVMAAGGGAPGIPGVLPGNLPPPGAAAIGGGGQLGLPAPAGGGLVPIGPPGAGGWQVMAPGGGAMAPAGGGAIPITPTPVPGQPPAAAPNAVESAQGMVGVATGLGIIKELQDASLRGERAATLHSQGLTAEAAIERNRNREIMALRGLDNTASNAAALAREAGNVGLSTDQWRDFQTGFQAYAGQYVGNKISADQAQRLQERVAGYAVGSRGWSGRDASRLLGTVISKAKDGASDDEILGQYGQLAQVLQLAPGYTGPLMGQLSEVVGEAVGPGGDFGDALDAAVLLRGVSERNPATASAYTRAVLRGLRKARMDPKQRDALGLRQGMNVFDQLEAVSRARDAAMAAGENGDEFLVAHGFGEIRMYGGLQTALNSGLAGGGFARARAEAGDRMARAQGLQEEAMRYAQSEEGRAAGTPSLVAAGRLEGAARGEEWQRFLQRARVSVAAANEQEKSEGGLLSWMNEKYQGFFGDRTEQETHAEAARALQNALSNSRAGREYLAQPYQPNGPMPWDVNISRREYLEHYRRGGEDSVFREMANELKKINTQLQTEGRRRERAEAAVRTAVGIGGGLGAYAASIRPPGAADGR